MHLHLLICSFAATHCVLWTSFDLNLAINRSFSCLFFTAGEGIFFARGSDRF